jgi:hypothetical protein
MNYMTVYSTHDSSRIESMPTVISVAVTAPRELVAIITTVSDGKTGVELEMDAGVVHPLQYHCFQ